jgi:predicted ABC-type ATPase
MIAPKIIIIAGPNGAGKTTFAREFLPNEAACPVFINADLIAAGLSPFQPEAAALEAGRLMLKQIQLQLTRGASFAIETTLSGRAYASQIPQWRAAGYFVELYFLALDSAEVAQSRVMQRVRQGGHYIAPEVIQRRFDAGVTNFLRLYRPRVNRWHLYDNTGKTPILMASGDNA